MPSTSPGYRSKLISAQATMLSVSGHWLLLNAGPVKASVFSPGSPYIFVRLRTRNSQLSSLQVICFQLIDVFIGVLMGFLLFGNLIQEIAVTDHIFARSVVSI